jgi:hypothetical protein
MTKLSAREQALEMALDELDGAIDSALDFYLRERDRGELSDTMLAAFSDDIDDLIEVYAERGGLERGGDR